MKLKKGGAAHVPEIPLKSHPGFYEKYRDRQLFSLEHNDNQ